MQDIGNRLRLIVIGHRRVRVRDLIDEDSIVENELTNPKSGRRRRNGRNEEALSQETAQAEPTPSETPSTEPDPLTDENVPMEEKKLKVLMVEVENLIHEPFETTEEIEAVTQEIIKTIRDIISMNPLYRESIKQVIHSGHQVVCPWSVASLGTGRLFFPRSIDG